MNPSGPGASLAALVVAGLSVCRPGVGQEAFQRVELGVGGSPYALLAGDFTGDGAQDLLASGEDSGRLVLLSGNGAGAFRRVAEIPAGDNPVGLAAGDLDGDGILDIVVANHETDYLTLLRGTGGGEFEPHAASPLRIDVSPHPHAVAAHDVTGDGRVDILVDDRDGSGLRLLAGGPDGMFRAVDADPIYMGGDPYRGMIVRDLDGDGILDLATPNETTIGVRRGLGRGEFGELVELDARPVAPFSIAAADIDGDGVLDLAAADGEGGPSVVWFRGEGEARYGAAESAGLAGSGAKSITAGDFDGDGLDDLVVSSWNSRELAFLAGGDDTPLPSAVRSGLNPWSLATADFDADGKLDIAVANAGDGTITVLLNRMDRD